MSLTLPKIETLGTTWWIEIFENIDKNKQDTVYKHIKNELERFNDTYSRFLSTSLISQLNDKKVLHNPTEECIELLTIANTWYKKTNGAFNIFVEEELVRRGYDSSYSFIEKDHAPKPYINQAQSLILSKDKIVLLEGRIDLGGFGKGYAIDLIASLLKKCGITYFLVNGGGDMYATSDNEQPITIYLEHPITPQKYLAQVSLKNQGFASSSSHKRRWGNKDKNHIVYTTNNQTYYDASFVIAGTTTTADIAATTLLFTPAESFVENMYYALYDDTEKKLLVSNNFTHITPL